MRPRSLSQIRLWFAAAVFSVFAAADFSQAATDNSQAPSAVTQTGNTQSPTAQTQGPNPPSSPNPQLPTTPNAGSSPTTPSSTLTTPTAPTTTTPSVAGFVEPKLAISEQRLSISQVTALRKTASEKGDKVKESCLYERLRGLQQTLESTQVAIAALEAATARTDQASERAERERVQKALELSRQLRTDAEGCVGNELVVGSRATSIAVSGGGQWDDPKAGPSELQTIRPVRLELPSRPNPASAFRPSR